MWAVLRTAAPTGRASRIPSDERAAANTAGVLGLPWGDLAISDRRTEPIDTHRIARTRNGTPYDGGNAVAFGVVNPPFCTAQAAGGVPGRT